MIDWTKTLSKLLAVLLLAILGLLGVPRAVDWWHGREYEGEGAEADLEESPLSVVVDNPVLIFHQADTSKSVLEQQMNMRRLKYRGEGDGLGSMFD